MANKEIKPKLVPLDRDVRFDGLVNIILEPTGYDERQIIGTQKRELAMYLEHMCGGFYEEGGIVQVESYLKGVAAGHTMLRLQAEKQNTKLPEVTEEMVDRHFQELIELNNDPRIALLLSAKRMVISDPQLGQSIRKLMKKEEQVQGEYFMYGFADIYSFFVKPPKISAN